MPLGRLEGTTMRGRTRDIGGHQEERITGITTHQEQHACFIAADNANNTAEAVLLLDMLGIQPEKEYQEKLRAERK